MNYSSRFWLYAPLCLFLALAALAGFHWWSVASALNRRLDAMKGHQAVPGIVIDWQSKTLSGFPFNLDIVFTGLSVKGAGAHGPFAWDSEKFALHTLTYERQKQVMEAAGQQHLTFMDMDGGSHDISFLPAELHASSVFRDGGLVRFDLDILDAGGKDSDGQPFTTERFQLHVRRAGEAIDMVATADAVKSPILQLRSLHLTGTLNHGAAFADALRGEASWPQGHAAWRARSGSVLHDVSGLDAHNGQRLQTLLSSFY